MSRPLSVFLGAVDENRSMRRDVVVSSLFSSPNKTNSISLTEYRWLLRFGRI